MNFNTRRDEDDGFSAVDSIMQRTHTFSSEPAIESLCRNSCVISRGRSRFVDEMHIPNAEIRSSAELLSELKKSEEGKPCLTKWKTSNHETGTVHVSSPSSIKETCADTLSISPSQASFYTQTTLLTTKRMWRVIPANSSYGGALSIAVWKKLRHYDQDERQSHASLHWDAITPILLKAFATHGAGDFSDGTMASTYSCEGSSKTRFEYCEDSPNSLAYFRAIQGHPGGIPFDPVLMVYIRIPYNWKGIQSVLEGGLIPGGHGMRQRTADNLLHTT